MIVSDLKESANPPGGKRGGSPCAPVHMTRIMPDQHPPARAQGQGTAGALHPSTHQAPARRAPGGGKRSSPATGIRRPWLDRAAAPGYFSQQ